MERSVAALNRIRSILLAAMALFCVLTLSGCIAKTVDELYALPRHSDEYYELQKVPQIADELCPAGERVGIHFHFQFLFSDGFRFVMGWAAIYSASMSAAIRQSSGQGRFL